MREDGLVVNNMNVNYGGNASVMRDTVINEIGPYTSQLTIGDTQNMNFVEGDIGPFWMNKEMRVSTKNDITTAEIMTKDKSKAQLLVDLRIAGVDTILHGVFKPELIEICISKTYLFMSPPKI